ncbi:MAG: DUF72 domain-containing protein [Thermoplasmata archaeon]|nr:DUF72 domain-containing protein [Thermoplasmata archaeon]
MIRVGCCGFRGGMENYFKNFKLVEIQQTFYRVPRIDTVRKWRRMAPPDFEFTMKAWQLITHTPKSPTYRKAGIKIDDENRYGYFKPTKEVFEAWEKCLEVAKILNSSIIVFQSPPSFHENAENIKNMKNFFSSISSDKMIYAWEPRGKWNDTTIQRLCSECNIIHCVDPFKTIKLCGMPAYYRLHGRNGYRYRYTEQELKELYNICLKDKEVYCLFNNTHMMENALEFQKMLESV